MFLSLASRHRGLTPHLRGALTGKPGFLKTAQALFCPALLSNPLDVCRSQRQAQAAPAAQDNPEQGRDGKGVSGSRRCSASPCLEHGQVHQGRSPGRGLVTRKHVPPGTHWGASEPKGKKHLLQISTSMKQSSHYRNIFHYIYS